MPKAERPGRYGNRKGGRMFLLLGVGIVAMLVVAFLHFVVFRFKKPRWLDWAALIGVSIGLIALLGAGGLHAGLVGILTLIIGSFWLMIFHKRVG